eukprot:gene29185-38661_t
MVRAVRAKKHGANKARIAMPEFQRIDTGRSRLRAAVEGEGPLVVMVHGFPESWYSWRHQIGAVAAAVRQHEPGAVEEIECAIDQHDPLAGSVAINHRLGGDVLHLAAEDLARMAERGAQIRLNWSKGRIDARQARDAAAWFQPDDLLRIVVVHHPLIEMIGGPMTANVRGGDRAAVALSRANVDLVLSGHIHAPFAWPYPGGDGRTYAVGAGTLSLRERGTPPGYSDINFILLGI